MAVAMDMSPHPIPTGPSRSRAEIGLIAVYAVIGSLLLGSVGAGFVLSGPVGSAVTTGDLHGLEIASR